MVWGIINMDLVGAVLDDQFGEIFPGPDRQQIHFIYHSLGFRREGALLCLLSFIRPAPASVCFQFS